MTTQTKAQTCGPLGCIEEIDNFNFLQYLQPDAAVPFESFATPQKVIGVAADFVPNPPGPSIAFANEEAFAAQT